MSHAHFNPHLPFRCATLDLHGPRARGLRPGLGCAICGRRRRGWISIRRTAATSQNRVCTPKGATKKNRGPLANWTRWKSNYNGIVYNSKTVYIYIYVHTHIYKYITTCFFSFSLPPTGLGSTRQRRLGARDPALGAAATALPGDLSLLGAAHARPGVAGFGRVSGKAMSPHRMAVGWRERERDRERESGLSLRSR